MDFMFSMVKTGRDSYLKEPLFRMYVNSSFVDILEPKILGFCKYLLFWILKMLSLYLSCFMQTSSFLLVLSIGTHHACFSFFALSCHLDSLICIHCSAPT